MNILDIIEWVIRLRLRYFETLPVRRRLTDSEHAAIAATIADYSPSPPWFAAPVSSLQ